jgi:putative methionine-R-sulfoxide reductase with GAF domain
MAPANRQPVLGAIAELANSRDERKRRASAIASLIRECGDHRWVGLYDVNESDIAIISWSGPGPPAHPRFPRTDGLSGAAVTAGGSIVANDVANDPRYLEAFSETRAEMIVPVSVRSRVRGTIDVESDIPNRFLRDDRAFLEACARAATPLWLESPHLS